MLTLPRAEARSQSSATNEPNSPSITLGVDLTESRTYLDDNDSPLSSSFTNPLDVLQLYVLTGNLPSVIDYDATSLLTLGRQIVSIGSKRQIERVSYANVIENCTNAHRVSDSSRGDQLHAICIVPINQRPNMLAEIFDNELDSDKEQWRRSLTSMLALAPAM